MQTRLFPLGEVYGGDGYLMIDEKGRIYILSDVSPDLWPLSSTFSEGIEFLLLGKRPSRQQIESTWPETTASGSRAVYAITYNKWGKPSFKPAAVEAGG